MPEVAGQKDLRLLLAGFNIIVIFHNYSDNWLRIHQSEKIAQIALQKKALNIVFEEVKNFDDITERGERGFGSTNKPWREDVVKESST